MIVVAIDNSPMLAPNALLHAVQQAFGTDFAELSMVTTSHRKCQINVAVPGTPPFRVALFDSEQLSCDGTEDQNLRVAAAVRSALPANFPRVVALRDDGSMYVDLLPGMTPEMIGSGWRDISEGGF